LAAQKEKETELKRRLGYFSRWRWVTSDFIQLSVLFCLHDHYKDKQKLWK
jgi:hypothetical protein